MPTLPKIFRPVMQNTFVFLFSLIAVSDSEWLTFAITLAKVDKIWSLMVLGSELASNGMITWDNWVLVRLSNKLIQNGLPLQRPWRLLT